MDRCVSTDRQSISLALRIDRHILCTAYGMRKDDGGQRRSYRNLPRL